MARNYNNRGKSRKNKTWNIIKAVALGLCVFMLGAGAAVAFAPKDLNDKNLLKDVKYVEMIKETAGGLKIDWDDDGSFALSGKHEEKDTTNNSKYEHAFATVKLAKGDYVIASNNKRADTDTYGMYIVVGGDKIEVLDEKVNFSVTAEEGETVVIGFFVKHDVFILRADFEPVLVAKGESTEFYND